MRAVVTKTVSGVEYKIQQLGAKAGRAVLTRLVKLLGPGAEAPDGESFAKLAESLNDADIDFLCETFAGATRVSPKPDTELLLKDVFDDHFAGQYGAMLSWLWASIEVNFGTFLKELGLDPAVLARKMQTVGNSNATTPSGTSSAPATGA